MKFDGKVKSYMKNQLVIINQDTRLADAVKQMRSAQSGIAIVKSGEVITGVITSSDIFSALVQGVFSESVEGILLSRDNIDDLKAINMMRGPLSVEFMTSCELGGTNPCIQLYEDDTIEDAIKVMEISSIHHLLVIGNDGDVVGTLSSNDILKAFED